MSNGDKLSPALERALENQLLDTLPAKVGRSLSEARLKRIQAVHRLVECGGSIEASIKIVHAEEQSGGRHIELASLERDFRRWYKQHTIDEAAKAIVADDAATGTKALGKLRASDAHAQVSKKRQPKI